MRNIGICGGSSIRELGSVSDVTLFFDSVVAYAIPSTNRDWSLISVMSGKKTWTKRQA